MEKNRKCKLHFGDRTNRICFVLDGGGGGIKFNSKSQSNNEIYISRKKEKIKKTRCILKVTYLSKLIDKKTPLILIQ